MTPARAGWIVAKAELAEERLTPWERTFIDDIGARLAKYGDRMRLSDRQEEVLESIAEKCA